MPRTDEANQQIREERKKQILRAAVKVFARKGLTDTKIADIAAAAGISHGLAYRYFTSKEEVFAALVTQAMQGTARVFRDALQQSGTPLERIRWLTQQILPDMRQQSDYAVVLLHAMTSEAVPEEVREVAAQQSEIVHDVFLQLIEEGQSCDEVVVGDPEQLVALYLACIQGLTLQASTSKGLLPTFPDADAVLRILKA